jgi:hypothetical protein
MFLDIIRMVNIRIGPKSIQEIGKRAARMCHARGLEIYPVQGKRGIVSAYPTHVLAEIFADIHLGHTTQLPKPFKPN